MPRIFALFLLLGLTFFGLSYAPFWNPDEGRYAGASYEMAFTLSGAENVYGQGPDWLVPHLNTMTRLNKPPLIYWGSAGAFSLFGPSEWAGRLAPATGAAIVLLLLYFWGKRAFGVRAGIGAALVWTTAIFCAAMGRTANTDMLLCAAMWIAAFGIFFAVESPKKLLFGAVAGVGMGLALLAKGPVGMALPLVAAFLYLGVSRSWKKAPWGALGVAFLVAFAVGLPWYFAVEMRRPGFIERFIFEENLGRFSGEEAFHKASPFWFYVPVVVVGLLPWAGFLIPALSRWREDDDLAARTRVFAATWAFFIIGFFSLSSTKLISYILPAFPALALLVGICLADWPKYGRFVRGAAVAFTLFLNLVLVVAVSGFPKRDRQTREWKIAPGVLLDNKVWSSEKGAPWVWGIAALMATSSALLLLANRRPNGKTLILAHGASSGATVIFILFLAGEIAKYEDVSGILKPLQSQLKPEDRVVGYRAFAPAAMFYFGRPVTWFHFKNTSGLIPAELEKSPYFYLLDGENDLEAWQEKQPKTGRTFVITRGFLDEEHRPNYVEWIRNNDFFVYANAPKPADFNESHVAPRKVDAPEVFGQPKPESLKD